MKCLRRDKLCGGCSAAFISSMLHFVTSAGKVVCDAKNYAHYKRFRKVAGFRACIVYDCVFLSI